MADFSQHFYNQQIKQQQRWATMRAAQVAQQRVGQTTELDTGLPTAKGTKRQLIGTVVGIAAVFAVLILLVAFHVI